MGKEALMSSHVLKFTSAETLRPALQIIKTKPGKSVVTGCELLCKKGFDPLVFGDVSLIVDPTAQELADIAESTAEFMDKVLGIEPKLQCLVIQLKAVQRVLWLKRFNLQQNLLKMANI